MLFKIHQNLQYLQLVIGISFVSLMFFTFETLLVFGVGYLLTIPLAFIIYFKNIKTIKTQT